MGAKMKASPCPGTALGLFYNGNKKSWQDGAVLELEGSKRLCLIAPGGPN